MADVNTRIPAGRENPTTKEPPTDNKRRKSRNGSHTNSTQDLFENTNGVEIIQNKQLNKIKGESSNLSHMEEPASKQPAHKCTTEYNRWWME